MLSLFRPRLTRKAEWLTGPTWLCAACAVKQALLKGAFVLRCSVPCSHSQSNTFTSASDHNKDTFSMPTREKSTPYPLLRPLPLLPPLLAPRTHLYKIWASAKHWCQRVKISPLPLFLNSRSPGPPAAGSISKTQRRGMSYNNTI